MANNPSFTWPTVDDDLFNRYIRGATLRSLCYHCRSYSHLAYHCPMRGSDHRVTSSASSVTSQYAAGASAGQPSRSSSSYNMSRSSPPPYSAQPFLAPPPAISTPTYLSIFQQLRTLPEVRLSVSP